MQSIPVYKLALIDADNHQVVLRPGGAHEIDLVQQILAELGTRRIGLTATKARVLTEVEAAVKAVLAQFKVDATRF